MNSKGDVDAERATIHEEPLEGPVKGSRNWSSWIRVHPWTTALVALFVVCCVVAVVVAPVCATGHCGTSKSNDEEDDGTSLTLILRFTDKQLDALDIVPAVLREFTSRLLLSSSALQLLTFTDESVLREARKYLRKHPDLELLLRDFSMRVIPQQPLDDTTLQAILNVMAPGVSVPDAAQQALDEASAVLNDISTGRKLNQALGAPITPNDPYFAQQWFHQTIKSPQAWSGSTGAPDIIVAVIDTGTDLTHPDLINNLWTNPGEIPGNGIDDDGNGYVDDYYGYDFAGACLNNQKNVQGFCIQCVGKADPQGMDGRSGAAHGTHVAGLIAAIQNNALGITGVAPNVKLMTLKVDNCVQSMGFTTAAILSAFDYAYRMGAHIVSCSFGPSIYNYNWPDSFANDSSGGWYDPMQARYQKAYIDAITPLNNKGVLVVAAAGNEYTDMDHYTDYGFFYGPCNTPLPNILCVGASSPTDSILAFSNFGNKTVDVVAPGQSIYSTWLQSAGQLYGTYSGTSQATPIVAGVAALVLTTLSAADGVFLRAEQLKSIIMNTGDYKASLAAVTVTSSRVNAANAVQAAMKAASLGGSFVSVKPSATFQPTVTSILSAGLSDTYFTRPSGGGFSTAGQSVLDTGVRAGPSSAFTSFKVANSLLYSKSMMYLAAAGTYGLQVTTTLNKANYQIVVGGSVLNTNLPTTVFVASAAGYYTFEVYINTPTSALTVTWKAPGATSYVPSSNFYISTTTTTVLPSYAQNLSLASGFQVYYTPLLSAPATGTLKSLTSTSSFTSTTIVADLNFAAGAFKTALFPSGTVLPAAVGYATTTLQTSGGSFMFKLICKGCNLIINDLMVIDSWDTNSAGSAALARTSGCLQLTSGQEYGLTVQFATADLAGSPMMLTAGGCAGGSASTSVAANTSTQLFWNIASNRAGWIGGLQCDVWRNASLGADGSAPTYKFRLPKSPTQDELLYGSQSSPFSFAIASNLPGISTAYPATRGGLFSVRCWTYWDVPAGTVKLSSPASAANGLRYNAYLGGRQVAGSGVSSTLFSAPSTNTLKGSLQLLAVEWFNVTSTTTLTLQLNSKTMAIDLSSMKLPLQIVSQTTKLMGSPGHYSQAYATTGVDVAASVSNDMTEFIASGYVTTNLEGLSYNASYARSLRAKVRYGRSSGYFVLSLPESANYTMQVNEPAFQTSTIQFGNVTVKNAGQFRGTSTPAARSSFQTFLPINPDGNLYFAYITMIVKSQSPDQNVLYNLTITSPVEDAGPMNTQVWYRAASAPTV